MSEAKRQQLRKKYAEELIRSFRRVSAGSVLSESGKAADRIVEPTLDDIFIEPNLTKAVPLSKHQADDPDASLNPFKQPQEYERLRHESRRWEMSQRVQETLPAMKAIEPEVAAVILGDPGGGKSTLLRWLLVDNAKKILDDKDGLLPFFLPLSRFANQKLSLEKFLLSDDAFDHLPTTLREMKEGIKTLIKEALSAKKPSFLLLLDGLDEMPTEARRELAPKIQAFIDTFAGEGKPAKVILSSRFFGYAEAPLRDPVVQLTVVPFQDEQIRTFSRRWHLWLEKRLHREQANLDMAHSQAKQFEEEIFKEPAILSLVRNPLLLTLIAVLVRQGKRLPKKRVQVYDKALEQLMVEWEDQRTESRHLPQEKKLEYSQACALWAPIARQMHEIGLSAIPRKKMEELLNKQLQILERDETAEEWLTGLGDKSCLLQEKGKDLFGFLHQTFQEYLAAMDLYKDGVFIPEIKKYIADPRWSEVICLAGGYLGVIARGGIDNKSVASKLLETILENKSPYQNLLCWDLFLAARCLAGEINPRRQVEKKILEGLIDRAQHAPMYPQREQALGWLVENAPVPLDESILRSATTEMATNKEWRMHYRLAHWFEKQKNLPEELLDQLCEAKPFLVRRLSRVIRWHRGNLTEDLVTLCGSEDGFPWLDHDRVANRILYQNDSLLWKSAELQGSKAKLFVSRFLLQNEMEVQAQQALLSLLQDPGPTIRLGAATLLIGTKFSAQANKAFLELLNEGDLELTLQVTNRIPQEAIARNAAYKWIQSSDIPSMLRFLDGYRGHARFSPELEDLAQKTLINTLQSQDLELSEKAKEILLRQSLTAQSHESLRQLLIHERADLRLSAALCLVSKPTVGRTSSLTSYSQTRQTLLELLHETDAVIRRKAAQHLHLYYKEKRPAVAEVLAESLTGPSPALRLQFAGYLISEPKFYTVARQAVGDLLKSGEPKQKIEAATILLHNEIDIDQAQKALVSILSQESLSEFHFEVSELLQGTELIPEVKKQLLEILGRSGWLMQYYATQSLPTSSRQLTMLDLIFGGDAHLRRRAAFQLWDMESDEEVGSVKKQLTARLPLPLPDSLANLTPEDPLFEAAWLYAMIDTKSSTPE